MTTKTKSKIVDAAWPPIVEVQFGSGKTGYQVAYQITENGMRRRYRKSFSTKAAALADAAEQRAIKHNEGVAGLSVPLDDRVVAARCLRKLEPYKATLDDAVDYYVEHVLKLRAAPTVPEVVAQFLADKEKAGRDAKTIKQAGIIWNKFAGAFSDRHLSEISVEEYQQWFDGIEGAPKTRANYRNLVRQLYRTAIRKKYVLENIVDQTDKIEGIEGKRGFLSVAAVASLLKHAPNYDLLPYAVMMLFGGVRREELEGEDGSEVVGWENVNLTDKSVVVSAATVKTRRQRVIPLTDTAVAWLRSCRKLTGPVTDKTNFRKRFDAWREAAGVIQGWPDNALRHTFGTMHATHYQDHGKTANIMGNSVDVVKRHYLGVTTRQDAARFWKLRPNKSTKVIAMTEVKAEQGTEPTQDQQAANA